MQCGPKRQPSRTTQEVDEHCRSRSINASSLRSTCEIPSVAIVVNDAHHILPLKSHHDWNSSSRFEPQDGSEIFPLLPSFTFHASRHQSVDNRTWPSESRRNSRWRRFLRQAVWRSWNTQIIWLCLYFSFNLLLTLSNKSVMSEFPFPYTLTALHALCSSIGGAILRLRGYYQPKRLSGKSELALAGFSILYAVNIAVSNVSLHLVTVPFHQVVRAITPLFTTVLSSLLLGTHVTRSRLMALLPVIVGVVLATFGDYYFTTPGLLLTLLGTILAALKTIYTNVLQASTRSSAHVAPPSLPSRPSTYTIYSRLYSSGPSHRKNTSNRYRQDAFTTTESSHSNFSRHGWLRLLVPPNLGLHPLDLLTRMSPLAFVQCVLLAQLSGELVRLRQFTSNTTVSFLFNVPASFFSYTSQNNFNTSIIDKNGTIYNCTEPTSNTVASFSRMSTSLLLTLLMNGFIAFGLNVVSFTANGRVGPLSMTVAANVKQVLTILFAVSLFNLTITPTNALGISITLAGGAYYAWVEYASKRDRRLH